MKCDSCDLESDWDQAFRLTRKSFSLQKARNLCPSCWSIRQAADWRLCVYFSLALAAVTILPAVIILGPRGQIGRILFWGYVLLFVPCVTLLHELGHAATGIALGLRLFAIGYGLTGRVLFRVHIRNCALEIRSSLSGGYVRMAARSARWIRLRWWLMVLGGPLFNGVLGALSVMVARREPSLEAVLQPFAWANLIFLAASLFPWKYVTPYGFSPSDGLALVTLPFTAGERLRQQVPVYAAWEAFECLRQKDYQAAIAWAEKGQREYPGEVNNRCMLGTALLGLDRFVEARTLFLELAAIGEPPASTPPYQAVFLNNVAWTDLMTDDPQLLDEADQYSARAMQLTPWVAEIKGTRGMVLVTLGRTAEGIPLLEQAMKENEEKANKALNACYLAIGFKNEGNLAASQRLLEQARRFDPECSLLPRVLEQLREGPKTQAVAENSVHPQMVGG
jgi:hypothetical protein